MRLVAITNTETQITYTVYENRVALAAYTIDKPDFLPANEVEGVRVATYVEKA